MKILSVEEISADSVPRGWESKYYKMFFDIITNRMTYIIKGTNIDVRTAIFTSRRLYGANKKVSLAYLKNASTLIASPVKGTTHVKAKAKKY